MTEPTENGVTDRAVEPVRYNYSLICGDEEKPITNGKRLLAS